MLVFCCCQPAAEIDGGGVEYIVADALHVVGFDPHVNLVDFLEREINRFADTAIEIERKELCAAN